MSFPFPGLIDSLTRVSLLGMFPYPRLMNATQDTLKECVAALVKGFPVEDIWLLETGKAKECGLNKPINLIVIVSGESEPALVESSASELIQARPEWAEVDVFAFSLSTMTRIPRPLLLKMALTSGRNVYCK